MATFKEFPILEVASRLDLRFIKRGPGSERIYRCPFCGDSEKHPNKGHLYLNVETDTFYCQRCGAEGNSLLLWSKVRKIDTKQAYKELISNIEPEKVVCSKSSEDKIAPPEIRDAVYRSFLQMLSLYPEHKKDLLDRGLDESTVHRNGYKSVPGEAQTRWKITRSLTESGLSLEGIPGFFTRNGRHGLFWDFYAPPGYFIPVKDNNGMIQGLQIRLETYTIQIDSESRTGSKTINGVKKAIAWVEATHSGERVIVAGTDKNYKTVLNFRQGEEVTVVAKKKNSGDYTVLYLYCIEDGKYRWFSSGGMPNGTSSKAFAHYTGGKGKLWLTEGPLKADVASHLLSTPFIGVPGVSAWETARPVLDRFKPRLPFLKKEVIVAFDSDVKTKPHLTDTLQKFLKELKDSGFKPVNATWPTSAGKGIDDALLKLAKCELKEITFTLNGVPVTVRRETRTTVRVG